MMDQVKLVHGMSVRTLVEMRAGVIGGCGEKDVLLAGTFGVLDEGQLDNWVAKFGELYLVVSKRELLAGVKFEVREELDAVGLENSDLATSRLVYMLMAYLKRIGKPEMRTSIKVDGQSDTEFSVYIKDAGIGVDVGYEVQVNSVSGKLKRPGYRVYTMEVQGGGRHHPPEDVDVTHLETLSQDDAIVCVGCLLAKDAMLGLPDYPEALALHEQVLEQAW